jgi:quercetin dioxygenase-like cupin family protein
MDGSRFDDIVKAFTRSVSRRRVLGSVALAPGFPALGVAAAQEPTPRTQEPQPDPDVAAEGTCGASGASCANTTDCCEGFCHHFGGKCGRKKKKGKKRRVLTGNCRCDSTPGEAGISNAVLGAVLPVAAPGYRLQMTELVWEPGAYSTSHSHPLAQVACVMEGKLAMTMQEGAATLTRGGTGSTPASSEPLVVNQEVVLGPRDCVSYDEYAAHTVHTVWNASKGTTRMWMADLVKIGEPYITYEPAASTPAP